MRQDRAGLCEARKGRRGGAIHGQVWSGLVSRDAAKQATLVVAGVAQRGTAWRGVVRQAGHGSTWHGVARKGLPMKMSDAPDGTKYIVRINYAYDNHANNLMKVNGEWKRFYDEDCTLPFTGPSHRKKRKKGQRYGTHRP